MTKGKPEETCGDFGGRRNDGEPCGRASGWGTPNDSGKCKKCLGTSPDGESHEGNQFAMKSGIHSDPVNLFDWLAENDEGALAYILGKLHDYAKRADEQVFVADVSGAESFEDVETKLTAYGDDVLFMCIRDYARWRGQKRQLKEGLITEQMRSSDGSPYKVKDSNPVNLDLDRMDKTTLRGKDKLGLLPSPEAKQAEADSELGELVRRQLED